MATVALALVLVFTLLLIGQLVLGERPSTLRHLVLQLAAAAVRRQRPIADLLQRAAVDHRRRDRRVIQTIADELDCGHTFGDALQMAAPQHFSAAQCALLRGAEGKDNFGPTIEGMRHTAGTDLTAGARLHLALAYPALLAVAFTLPTAASEWIAGFNVRGGPTPSTAPKGNTWFWAAVAAVALYVGMARLLGTTATGVVVVWSSAPPTSPAVGRAHTQPHPPASRRVLGDGRRRRAQRTPAPRSTGRRRAIQYSQPAGSVRGPRPRDLEGPRPKATRRVARRIGGTPPTGGHPPSARRQRGRPSSQSQRAPAALDPGGCSTGLWRSHRVRVSAGHGAYQLRAGGDLRMVATRQPHLAHQGGLVLAEILCAFAVLAVVISVAFMGHSNHLHQAVEAMNHTRARYVAFSLVEIARARAEMGALEEGTFTADPTTWHLPAASQPEARWHVQRHPNHPTLLQVHAVVKWRTPSMGHSTDRQHTVSDEALVAIPGEPR